MCSGDVITDIIYAPTFWLCPMENPNPTVFFQKRAWSNSSVCGSSLTKQNPSAVQREMRAIYCEKYVTEAKLCHIGGEHCCSSYSSLTRLNTAFKSGDRVRYRAEEASKLATWPERKKNKTKKEKREPSDRQAQSQCTPKALSPEPSLTLLMSLLECTSDGGWEASGWYKC